MWDYKKIFKNRELRLKLINCLRFIPTKPYLKMVYRIKTGKKLNLKNPITLCDKLNWLKINDVHEEYTQLVDKIAVREYIKTNLGEEYLFPIYGTWDHYTDIDFNSLPDKFVLKCNHDSASINIIKDKNTIDHIELEKFYENRLRINAYNIGREYPYKDIKPKIIAEKYMIDDENCDIKDYKFFCFNGKPEVLLIASDRSSDMRTDFFDMNFNHLDIKRIYEFSDKKIEKPKNFEKMKEIAAKLTKNMKFVRLDLYEVGEKIYFGEFTFFPAGGFWPLKPEKWEYDLGKLINVDNC